MASCSRNEKKVVYDRLGWRGGRGKWQMPAGAAILVVRAPVGQAVIGGNDESGCDRSMESQSAGSGRRELAALVARLLSMLSKKNSTASSFSSPSPPPPPPPSPSSRSRAAAAMESGGSWTSSTAGSAVFLASIRQRFCRTRFRRRNSFFATACVANAPDNNRKKNKRQSRAKKNFGPGVGGSTATGSQTQRAGRPRKFIRISIEIISRKVHTTSVRNCSCSI